MTKNKGIIYLSGGMEKAKDLGGAWREICGAKLTELGFVPIDITAMDKLYKETFGPVYMKGDPEFLLQTKSNVRYQLIYTDMRLIKDDTDAVVALYDESFRLGAGSFAECQLAYDSEKPLFVVSGFGTLTEVPLWLKALSTKMFTSFEDLYAYLEALPPGILKTDRYGNHHSESHYLCSLCGEAFEKRKHHFVSKVSPLYCKGCVEVVQKTREEHTDRYQFISELLNRS
jgi:hypothetical protein